MFSKILVANRGEVAVRIIRACKEMGIATVAVYSEADRDALHVALADQSYCIGRAEASRSYLDGRQIVSTALLAGAQAVHPGYGFLSENPQFARLCRDNGLAFIGPDPKSMEEIGNKAALKDRLAEAGLPVIPGSGELRSSEEAHRAAASIGYPVMLKASVGGGGRGIRLVSSPKELQSSWDQASAEAASAFGDGGLYVEKFIRPARHVEFQILADEQGNVVCLGERDCSLQRRNQKLVEESPSPAVDPALREKATKLAVEAVRSIGYVGAGTLEFLLDPSGNLWFMEMNVRLQVEHSVTEMLTGIDIVKWQIRIAAGVPLSFSQADIALEGCAIECRINARSCGELHMLHVPGGPSVRFDTALAKGSTVTPYYDSLIGKLVVFAQTREEALRKLKAALCELIIQGIETNIEEQLSIVDDERFTSGDYDLTFMGRRHGAWHS